VGLSIKREGIMWQEGRSEKKQASLYPDNVLGGRGWYSREIKLKESK
jgi:hypothetical protein